MNGYLYENKNITIKSFTSYELKNCVFCLQIDTVKNS